MAGGENLSLSFNIGLGTRAPELELLVYFLQVCDAVTSLEFSFCEFPGQTLVGVLDALAQRKVLERFSLTLEEKEYSEEEIASLARCLKQCPIRMFSLIISSLKENDMAMICDALADRPLEFLEFQGDTESGRVMPSEGGAVLGRFIGMHPTLSKLVVVQGFDKQGVDALLPGLMKSQCLQDLRIGHCCISDEGLLAMAENFKSSSQFKLVHFWGYSRAENESIKCIAEALKENATLEQLALNFNFELDGVAQGAFIDALSHNVTLTELIFNGGLNDYRRNATIDNLLLRNKNLIPAAVRRAALMLIGICRSNNYEGMGKFVVFPKDVVRLIAQAVWATRRDPVWIQALE